MMPTRLKEDIMNLKQYFENTKGLGILSTADSSGRVDAAVYARPHFMEDGTMALIMRDRLSHHNLQSNPHATYLFKEEGIGYNGKRLFMTKVREEQNSELLESLRRESPHTAMVNISFLYFLNWTKNCRLSEMGSKCFLHSPLICILIRFMKR